MIPAGDDSRLVVAALGAQRHEGVGRVARRPMVDEYAAVEQQQRIERREDLRARLVDRAHHLVRVRIRVRVTVRVRVRVTVRVRVRVRVRVMVGLGLGLG